MIRLALQVVALAGGLGLLLLAGALYLAAQDPGFVGLVP